MLSFGSLYYNFFDYMDVWLKLMAQEAESLIIDDTREMMIVFVYDTECLKDEADDPVKAVLYFHPSWVSDTQKLALCGQLMGISYFLNDCFFKPRVIALQNGKFVLKEFGRFILAIGTDRNISDYLLQHRAELLVDLIKFYHRNLQLVYDQFPLQSQYKHLSEKLYHIFETYLPILQYNGNIFQYVPRLRVPKTASNIFLEAIQTLQCCQQTKGILGGAILYHNKVLASQLSEKMTKQIILTDPLHISTTGELLTSTEFHIPNGVVMMVVYVDQEQYRNLQLETNKVQKLQTSQLSNGSIHYPYNKRKMKRVNSLIFTHIPEESTNQSHLETKGETISINPFQAPSRPKSLQIRPTHLSLSGKNLNNKELPESGIASINFDENDSYPEFIGRTSICSTPMAENKVLPVSNVMSICANPTDYKNSNNNSEPSKQNNTQMNSRNTIRKDFENFFHNFISNPNKLERRNSLTDLQQSLTKFSKKITLKQYQNTNKVDTNPNTGENYKDISNFDKNCEEAPTDFIENGDEYDNSDENNQTTHTITDPTNPVFNTNGQPISRSLFQEFLEKYYKLWGEESLENNQREDNEITQLIEEFKEFDMELKKLDESIRSTSSVITLKKDVNLNLNLEGETFMKTQLDKMALSLPLKSISMMIPCNEKSVTVVGSNRKQFDYGGSGVPLTPLMAKLSVLALNEGGLNWDRIPGSKIDIQTPIMTAKTLNHRLSTLKCDDAVDALRTVPGPNHNMDGLQKAELYICGQQNMTLLLIMETGCSQQQKLVQKMFDICVAKFPNMEINLNKSLNINVEGDRRDSTYSFISLDKKWDALQRNGPWNPLEINTIEAMHCDLLGTEEKRVTDLILRTHDNVFYGYKLGRTEVFYKESAKELSGIPPPSDIMGNIIHKAKTNLERDHSFVML